MGNNQSTASAGRSNKADLNTSTAISPSQARTPASVSQFSSTHFNGLRTENNQDLSRNQSPSAAPKACGPARVSSRDTTSSQSNPHRQQRPFSFTEIPKRSEEVKPSVGSNNNITNSIAVSDQAFRLESSGRTTQIEEMPSSSSATPAKLSLEVCPGPIVESDWVASTGTAISSAMNAKSGPTSTSMISASHDGLETAIKLMHLKAAIGLLRELRNNASPRELAALREALESSESSECAISEVGTACTTLMSRNPWSLRHKRRSGAKLTSSTLQKLSLHRRHQEADTAMVSQTLPSMRMPSKINCQSLSTSPPGALSITYHEFVRTLASPESPSTPQPVLLHPECLRVIPRISITRVPESCQFAEDRVPTVAIGAPGTSQMSLQDRRNTRTDRDEGTCGRKNAILGLATMPISKYPQQSLIAKQRPIAPRLIHETCPPMPPLSIDSGYSSDTSLTLPSIDQEKSSTPPLSVSWQPNAWPRRSDSITSRRSDRVQEGKLLDQHRHHLRSSMGMNAPVHGRSWAIQRRPDSRQQSRIKDSNIPTEANRTSADVFFKTPSARIDIRGLAELEAERPPPLPTRSQRRRVQPVCNKRKAPNAEPLFSRARQIAELEAGLPPIPPLRSSRRSQKLLLKAQTSSSAGDRLHDLQLAELEGDAIAAPMCSRRRSLPSSYRRTTTETVKVKRRYFSVSFDVASHGIAASSMGSVFFEIGPTTPTAPPTTWSPRAQQVGDIPVQSEVCADGLLSEPSKKLKVCKSLSDLSIDSNETKDSKRSLRIYTHDSPLPMPPIDIRAQYMQSIAQGNAEDEIQPSPTPHLMAPSTAPTMPRLLDSVGDTGSTPRTPPIRK